MLASVDGRESIASIGRDTGEDRCADRLRDTGEDRCANRLRALKASSGASAEYTGELQVFFFQ